MNNSLHYGRSGFNFKSVIEHMLWIKFISISLKLLHYNDVIMAAIASQITSLTIVFSTVYSDADQRKHQSSASLAFVQGIPGKTGEFPTQMASKGENVSIWWRHHVVGHTTFLTSQHKFRQWLGAFRQQTITWANVDPDLCHHMVSLGHHELTRIWMDEQVVMRTTIWVKI